MSIWNVLGALTGVYLAYSLTVLMWAIFLSDRRAPTEPPVGIRLWAARIFIIPAIPGIALWALVID